MGQVCPPQLRAGQVQAGQVRVGQVRVGQVWIEITILTPPIVPGGYALLEHRDVLVVRHGSTLSATTLFWDGLAMRSIRLASLHTYARLRGDVRGRDGGVREELAAGAMKRKPRKLLPGLRAR